MADEVLQMLDQSGLKLVHPVAANTINMKS